MYNSFHAVLLQLLSKSLRAELLGDRVNMIWATVSSLSCFCWLHEVVKSRTWMSDWTELKLPIGGPIQQVLEKQIWSLERGIQTQVLESPTERGELKEQDGEDVVQHYCFHCIWKLVSFLCVSAPGFLPKRFKETLNQNLFPPAKKGRFEILLLSEEYIPFCFEKLITCL